MHQQDEGILGVIDAEAEGDAVGGGGLTDGVVGSHTVSIGTQGQAHLHRAMDTLVLQYRKSGCVNTGRDRETERETERDKQIYR